MSTHPRTLLSWRNSTSLPPAFSLSPAYFSTWGKVLSQVTNADNSFRSSTLMVENRYLFCCCSTLMKGKVLTSHQNARLERKRAELGWILWRENNGEMWPLEVLRPVQSYSMLNFSMDQTWTFLLGEDPRMHSMAAWHACLPRRPKGQTARW